VGRWRFEERTMQWEYFVLTMNDASWVGGVVDAAATSGKLNELGAQGWELVAAFDANVGHGASRSYTYVLKRPKAVVPPVRG
jgi:hypothetical protein